MERSCYLFFSSSKTLDRNIEEFWTGLEFKTFKQVLKRLEVPERVLNELIDSQGFICEMK